MATSSREGSAPAAIGALVDRIEDDARLDDVADRLRSASAPLSNGAAGDALRGRWLGHPLHPLLTDLPIGCWTSAAILDVVGGRRSRSAAQRLIGIGILCVPATAAAGAVDWRESDDARVHRVGLVHGVGNVVATALYVLSWRHRRRGAHLSGVILGMAGGVAASIAGHLGGHLAFGMSGDAPKDDADGSGSPVASTSSVTPDWRSTVSSIR
jgi:uncharacterized membrane protein